ncbi:fructosamine kinase family protein [Thiohalophilus thiocyanatoxydans]|uniref:Fructosamine-3-kinase n=1 Tax=Thiohalophilus thiocyanatoxydans TaxID=381308 RepID=A0A4R8IF50_9GAMM|nr:fructosamine kinase family protein [Thiohalophilus thiocyanatoxydans]TDX96898.1 fructosamine-3-kinase [Thiohalophilus thiocyanatoxydans]
MNQDELARVIGEALGEPFTIDNMSGIGGGCISSASRIDGGGRRYFVKFNRADLLDMFEAEAEGLAAMGEAEAVRVPQPVTSGVSDGQAYLVMEYLETGGSGDMARFGEQLAQMHRHTRAQFGWHRDNTIGSTPQPNGWSADWVSFWQEQRLGFQLDLARRHGAGSALYDRGQQLKERVADFFTDYRPVASVLHGDLWAGNYAFTRDGEAVIFDPAVYFGDREADLAMTELFGGFSRSFYNGYDAAWPIDPGYATRKTFYNLYHILNHYNLFGGGYASQAQRMIDQLLSEVR